MNLAFVRRASSMVEGKRKPLSNGFRQMVECCIMTRVSWDSLRNLDSCLFVSEIHCDRRQHPGQKNMQITHIVAQGLLDPLNSSANAASFPILKLTIAPFLVKIYRIVQHFWTMH